MSFFILFLLLMMMMIIHYYLFQNTRVNYLPENNNDGQVQSGDEEEGEGKSSADDGVGMGVYNAQFSFADNSKGFLMDDEYSSNNSNNDSASVMPVNSFANQSGSVNSSANSNSSVNGGGSSRGGSASGGGGGGTSSRVSLKVKRKKRCDCGEEYVRNRALKKHKKKCALFTTHMGTCKEEMCNSPYHLF